MTEGGGLPVQDRRDNYRIVQGARGVAAAVMVLDWHPVQGFRCSRSRMRIGQQLHSLAKPSCQPVSPILLVVPEYWGFRVHFALRFPEKIPYSLLHQHVRQGWDLIDQKSLLKDLMREKIRHSYSLAWFANSCRLYSDGPRPCLRSLH